MDENDETAAKRTTIYHLAEIAGTSPSTVSAILSGNWKRRRISALTAERVTRIAAEQGYSVNLQASMLRRDRSHIIGMIVPKYDNRYFGAIAERFEAMARERGLFPVITCTQRDPDLEFEAARELISYQAEGLIVTGATEPDRIADFCAAAGVQSINLDLPGSKAPSVVSDNFGGALVLTRLILARQSADLSLRAPLWFIGGRQQDHNSSERLRGFAAAHAEAGLEVPPARILMPGYAGERIHRALSETGLQGPCGLFVNSTIALEGVVRYLTENRLLERVRFGSFDWDPFAALMAQNVGMAEQDVPAMLAHVFRLFETRETRVQRIEVPCALHPGMVAAAPVA